MNRDFTAVLFRWIYLILAALQQLFHSTITLTHITYGILFYYYPDTYGTPKHPHKHVIYICTSHTSIPCHGQQKTCVSFFDH